MQINPGYGYSFTSSGGGHNLTIEQPWFPWPIIEEELPPYTIVDESVGTTYKFRSVPGMVNSTIPQIGITADATKRLDQLPIPTTTYNFDATTHYSYIYLKVSWLGGTPDMYPVTDQTDILYPRVISTSIEQPSTDDSGFLLLATAYQEPTTKVITIWQLTTGSQWTDRLKTGTATARYYFATA
jgi:hypothetical protein